MNFCINFYQGCEFLDKVGELKIKMNDSHTDAGLLQYMENRPAEQRIVIDMTTMESEDVVKRISILQLIKSIHNNYTIMLDATIHHSILAEFYEENIPFFFKNYVDTWEKLATAAQYRVTDVYITNELAFDLVTVSAFCHDKNIKIRVFPNIAQSSAFVKIENTLKKFFIRPEDTIFYDELVDIYEFYGPLDKQDVLYRIYSSRQWRGSLNALILDLHTFEDVYSDRLIPQFGAQRTKCQKRCNQGRCDICTAAVDFAKAMYENADFRIKVTGPDTVEDIARKEKALRQVEQIINENFEE